MPIFTCVNVCRLHRLSCGDDAPYEISCRKKSTRRAHEEHKVSAWMVDVLSLICFSDRPVSRLLTRLRCEQYVKATISRGYNGVALGKRYDEARSGSGSNPRCQHPETVSLLQISRSLASSCVGPSGQARSGRGANSAVRNKILQYYRRFFQPRSSPQVEFVASQKQATPPTRMFREVIV